MSETPETTEIAEIAEIAETPEAPITGLDNLPGIELVEDDEEYVALVSPCVLLDEEERWTLSLEMGAEIYYRRVSLDRQDKLTKKRGNGRDRGLKSPDALDQILGWAILGWKGFKRQGIEVPYDKRLVSRLPEDVRAEVTSRLYLPCPDLSLFESGEQTKFYYRRLTSVENQALLDRHTQRGILDDQAYADDILRTCLLRWESVKDHEGQVVSFGKGAVKKLPNATKNEFAPFMTSAQPASDALLGN